MSARRLALLIGLIALGWTLALLRASPGPAATAARAGQPPAELAAAPTRTSTPPAAQTTPAPSADHRPSASAPADPRAGDTPAAKPAAQEDAARRERLARLAREAGQRQDARFDRAVELWKEQQKLPRQEPWASRLEGTLRGALQRDRLEQIAQRVECRATLCRMQFDASDPRTEQKLRRAHHFMRAVGVQTAGGVGVEGGKRVLVLYAVREGTYL
jgi:hypothetical protein